MKKLIYTIFVGSVLLIFTACEKTDDSGYTVPETYNFDNVSYTGQAERLAMLSELSTYMKTANTPGAAALDASKMKNMYSNSNNPFADATLNASTKQLKSKTTSNMVATFESYLDHAATTSLHTSATASNGTAGIATTNEGSKYLVNENGMEWTQVFTKSLMGACFYYQATAIYMGSGKMDVDNETVTPGKGTKMEHHWDEAFGYLGVPIDFPTNTSGLKFWGKYLNTHEGVYPLNKRVMDAFIKGRAAISNKDITTRDEQITALRKNWELIPVATAIYYLNKTKGVVNNNQERGLHFLSEVYGFISSIKWGAGTGSVTSAQVDAILTNLYGNADATQANAWNVDLAKIEAAKTALVGYFPELASVKDQL